MSNPREFGMSVCKALDISSKKVTNIEINCDIENYPSVIITRYITDEELGLIDEILQEYKLIPKEGKNGI